MYFASLVERNRSSRELVTLDTVTAQISCEDRFVLVDGLPVHYVHAGSGRPALLIHGLTGSAINWRLSVPVLARTASVYAIDLLNMGRSARVPNLDASLAATADRVAATMDALGLDQADIIGHSHGGAVALMLAARHPDRVRTLALVAPANPFSTVGDSLVRFYSTPLGARLARLAPFLPKRVQMRLLGRMYGDPSRIPAGSLPGYVDGLRVPGSPDHVLAIVRNWFSDMAALHSALPQVAHVPTLLLWGGRDRAVTPESAYQLQRELPNSELVVIPTAGHIVFEEFPEESNRLLLQWLRRDPLQHTSYAASDRTQAAPVPSRRPQPSVNIAARTAHAPSFQHLSPRL
jgi:pimeloyl-ACP methyl ester carboxylesterase